MDQKVVVLLEDEEELAALVRDLLADEGYEVVRVTSIEHLLAQCAQRSPCVALVDSLDPTQFDLWWVGPKLVQLGVPPVAFTAHLTATREFERDPHGFVGIVAKPFDAEQFLQLVDTICWEDHHCAAS